MAGPWLVQQAARRVGAAPRDRAVGARAVGQRRCTRPRGDRPVRSWTGLVGALRTRAAALRRGPDRRPVVDERRRVDVRATPVALASRTAAAERNLPDAGVDRRGITVAIHASRA